MRARPSGPSPAQLAARAANDDRRKAANDLAHRIRLGEVPYVTEDTRGPCMVTRGGKTCGLQGRRFRFTRFEPIGDPAYRNVGPALGDIVSSPEMCVGHAMQVIAGMNQRRQARG